MFGLVVAENHQRLQPFQLKPLDVRKVQYGRTETKRALTNVLDVVLDKYHYTSLPELNAVLRQYNILADRGSENSKIFKGGGLVYRILDEDGKPIGVPIKASDFYQKPTLTFLEEKYAPNEAKRQPFKSRIRNEIDKSFIGKALTLDELVKQLEKKGIYTSLRKNDAGLIYGITFVDHQTKCVFNGSTLGKQYSAKGIQEKCQAKETIKPDLQSQSIKRTEDISLPVHNKTPNTSNVASDHITTSVTANRDNLIQTLMQPEQAADYIPNQLNKKGKNKRNKTNVSNNQ
jgi:hypothetical protein